MWKWQRKKEIIAERDALKEALEKKEEAIKELHARLRGDQHDTGTHCEGCKNSIKQVDGFYVDRICKLDIKCKDRKESNL